MRGNLIPVTAKHTLDGIFNKGDEVFVQSVLYDKPKFIHGGLGAWYDSNYEPNGLTRPFKDEDGNILPLQQVEEFTLGDGKTKNYRANVCEDTYAPVGSYSHSLIILADGTEYSDAILGNRTLNYTFDKN